MKAMDTEQITWERYNGEKDQSSIDLSNNFYVPSINYTVNFTTPEIFQNREALINWAREVGRTYGFLIVIRASDRGRNGKQGRIYLCCERSGTYSRRRKNIIGEQHTRITGTKKCDCPFLLKGKELPNEEGWELTIGCGFHNHGMAEHLEGHSYAGRLTGEEEKLVVDMSKTLVRPRDILHTLKQRDSSNVSTMRTIYNARKKFRVVEYAGRSQMQQLMSKLSDHGYIEVHRRCPNTDTVKDILWAHPTSIKLLHAFPRVLIMDCTYKTNRYRLPLMEIVGITSTNMTFSVAFAYIEYEREDNYSWALDSLITLMHGQLVPSIIVTDRELALMNAIDKIFPTSRHFLCRWHIGRNIVTNCKKYFKTKQIWDQFVCAWNILVAADSEADFNFKFGKLNEDYRDYPDVLQYLKTNLINKYKEKFVSCWTDIITHFGTTTSNRAESAHAKLKRFLGSSLGNFETSWAKIHALLEMQHTDITASFEKSLNVVLHNFKPSQFKYLRGVVSITALEKILDESNRICTIGMDANACKCILRKTHGLPCAHELVEYARVNMPIPLDIIDVYWRKLDMTPIVSIVHDLVDDLNNRFKVELDLISQRFSKANNSEKIMMLKRLREMVNPTTSSLIEPEMKIQKRGNRVPKFESSTRRFPCAYELVESTQDTFSPNNISASTKSTRRRSKEKIVRARSSIRVDYQSQLPDFLRPFIIRTKDVQPDGNCGYRAIASMLGFGEEGWAQVRRDLLQELNNYPNLYASVFGCWERVEEFRQSLNHFEGAAPYDKWMTMPEMGYLIASHYNVVLLSISLLQSFTILPLRTLPLPLTARKNIAIGFVNNNHFIELQLKNGHPMPPIPINWHKSRLSIAEGWDVAIGNNMLMKKDLLSCEMYIDDCTIDID